MMKTQLYRLLLKDPGFSASYARTVNGCTERNARE